MSMTLAFAALLATPSVQAAQAAQAGQPATTEAIDPARLTAAKTTLEVLMPPAKRAVMFDTMLAPMMANIQQAMLSAPSLKAKLAKDPKFEQAFQRFMTQQQRRTAERLRGALPGMFTAMERAYARRFTVPQLQEISAFFTTPTGRVYMDQSMTIMSDPDVLAWQAQLMQSSMAGVEQDIEALAADAEAGQEK